MLPSTLLKLYDVLIIGSGPSGLSTALACARQFRQTLVLSSPSSQPFRNTAAEHMHNVLGFDHTPPESFRKVAVEQISTRYEGYVGFDDGADVVGVEKVDEAVQGYEGCFKVRDVKGREWIGRKVVLATGSRDVFPDIEGFDRVWGNGVIHCPYCHGYEQRGSLSAGFLYLSRDPTLIAAYLGSISLIIRFPKPSPTNDQAYSFTIYLDGADQGFFDTFEADETIKMLIRNGIKVDNRKINKLKMVPSKQGKITPDDHGQDLHLTFTDGSTDITKFILTHLPMILSPIGTTLAQSFNLPISPAGDITDLTMLGETKRVPGLYVAGDMMTGLKAVTVANYNGLVAGAGVTKALAMEDMMRFGRGEGGEVEGGELDLKQAGLGLGASANEVEA